MEKSMDGFESRMIARFRALCRHRAAWAAVCLLMGLAAAGCAKDKVSVAPEGLSEVTIYSLPQGAIVIFDGTERGWTYAQKPLVLKGVPYGWHTIRVSLPTYVLRIDQVRLERPKMDVRIRLSKKSFGRLTVVVDPPGAEVFVDSRYYGKASPAVDVDSLPFGEHTVFVRKKGFLSERRNIVVERQFHRAYRLRLKAKE